MKRLFVLLLLGAVALPMMGQVSLQTNQLPDNYLYDCWYNPDSTSQHLVLVREMAQVSKRLYGKYFSISKDPVRIYGVAVSMSTFDLESYIYEHWTSDGDVYKDSSAYYYYLNEMCDTGAYDEAYEYWGLYEHEADSLRLVSPQLMVNIKTTPVTYYINLGPMRDASLGPTILPSVPIPFYEMYFDSAVTMTDSFYVCMTCHNYSREDKCPGKKFYTWPVLWHKIALDPRPRPCSDKTGWCYLRTSPPDDWDFQMTTEYVYCIFPILDTSHRSDYVDTTLHSVAAAGLEQYVSVTPNPAVSEMRVVSSVGMSQVEAYDVKGVKVMDEWVSGPDVTLNVGTWPEGVYVMHLHTPLGIAVKRVVVKR